MAGQNRYTFNQNDILGKKFGLLTVKKFARKIGKTPIKYFYECICDCGNKKEVQRCNLIMDGHTRSCGCLRKISGKNNKGWTGFEDISGGWWKSIIGKAKYRNLPFSITIEDGWKLFLKQKGLCALTGLPLSMYSSKPTYHKDKSGKITDGMWMLKGKQMNNKSFQKIYRTASLDRTDSAKGYVKGNVQWVHKNINLMKGTFSQKEFIAICKLVSNFKK